MGILIFLSYSMPIDPRQQRFIDKLGSELGSHGLEPRTLGVTDYDADRPLVAIRRILSEANGLIAVAFRRSELVVPAPAKPTNRSKAGNGAAPESRWATSPYCHIEAAMAFQVGLPVLTLMESGVVRDGVFQDGVILSAVPIFDVTGPVRTYFRSAQWRQNLAKWEHRVRTVNDRKGYPPRRY